MVKSFAPWWTPTILAIGTGYVKIHGEPEAGSCTIAAPLDWVRLQASGRLLKVARSCVPQCGASTGRGVLKRLHRSRRPTARKSRASRTIQKGSAAKTKHPEVRMDSISSQPGRRATRLIRPLLAAAAFLVLTLFGAAALAQQAARAVAHRGGEDSLVIPSQLDTYEFFGMAASRLLMLGLIVCAAGVVFGLVVYAQLKNAPVHKAMLEVSELIYETCKTYLVTQAKFLGLLWLFIGAVIVVYYGVLKGEPAGIVLMILLFSVIGMAGSATVALFGLPGNTFPNSPNPLPALPANPYPVYAIPFNSAPDI